MDIWISTLVSVTAVSLISLVGVVALAREKEWLDRMTFHLVSLAAGVLLGGAVVHLIPHAVEQLGPGLGFPLWFLSGFLGFYLLERNLWTHHHGPPEDDDDGTGHGHSHTHPVVPMVLIGDSVHNLIDGMLIAAAFTADPSLGVITVVGVIAHEIPQEIGDFGVLVHGGLTPRRALLFNFLTGTAAIVGAVIALTLGSRIDGFASALVAIAAGNFLYIAAADLIPELHRNRGTGSGFADHIILISGVGLMLLLRVWLG
jgi:zinc and cadmium transporter